MRLTVAAIGNTSTLVLDNVQGEWQTNTSLSGINTVFFTTSAGVTTELNYAHPAGRGGNIHTKNIIEETCGFKILY